MNADTYRVGDLYITITAADYRQGYSDQPETYTPTVNVHTGTEPWHAKEGLEPTSVVIRGRHFHVHVNRASTLPLSIGRPMKRDRRAPGAAFMWTNGYATGITDAKTKVVLNRETQARKLIDAMVDEACAWLDANHPDWTKRSVAIAFEHEVRRQESEIENARRRIRQCEGEIEAIRTKAKRYQ